MKFDWRSISSLLLLFLYWKLISCLLLPFLFLEDPFSSSFFCYSALHAPFLVSNLLFSCHFILVRNIIFCYSNSIPFEVLHRISCQPFTPLGMSCVQQSSCLMWMPIFGLAEDRPTWHRIKLIVCRCLFSFDSIWYWSAQSGVVVITIPTMRTSQ